MSITFNSMTIGGVSPSLINHGLLIRVDVTYTLHHITSIFLPARYTSQLLRTPWTLGGAFPRPRAARALGTFCRGGGFGGHAAGLEVWMQGAAAQTAWANDELKPQNDELSIAHCDR